MYTRIVIRHQLQANARVFDSLLRDLPEPLHHWKSAPGRWSLLDIICHLADEEREDFRVRIRHVRTHPGTPLPPVDPEGWVASRAYARQSYGDKLEEFLRERAQSVLWLSELSDEGWDLGVEHPSAGFMTAHDLLVNWLAHDYHHIRQINRVLYEHLQANTTSNLTYAGDW